MVFFGHLQVAAARLAACVMGRVVARAEADAAAADAERHLVLLQQRVERIGRMTGAMRARALTSGGDRGEETLQRQLISAGIAAACVGAGLAAAYLMVRRPK